MIQQRDHEGLWKSYDLDSFIYEFGVPLVCADYQNSSDFKMR